VSTIIGYAFVAVLVLVALLNFLALREGRVKVITVIIADAVVFGALAVCDIRWGHTYRAYHAP
jgi:hypothetical protein